MKIGIKIFIGMLAVFCTFFTTVGLYTFDLSLLLIAILFAISIALVALEAHSESINPFKRS